MPPDWHKEKTMKGIKTNFLLILVLMLMFTYPACAEELSEGYIVKLSSNAVVLFSAESDEITPLGDEYYRAESIEAAYEMFSHKNIEAIFPDYQLELFDEVYPNVTSDEKINEQWNLDLIYADTAREKGLFGKGIKIAVLDSGLDTTNTDLKQANIMQGYNCIADANDVTDVSDNYGHGTNVCGVIAAQTDNQTDIAGIADETYIIPLKITNGKTLPLSNIYTGINKAIELDCDIINMSLGGALTDEIAINEFKSWIDKANDAGIAVIAAVGNGGTTLNYPAAFDNVIGVGSVDKNKVVAERSQYNESVFVVAPGVDVLTLSKNGGTETNTGTSLATPHVTAAVALIKELKPDCSLNEIKEILESTSADLGDTGYDIYYGHGLLDIKSILEKLQEYVPDVVVSQGMKDGTNRIHIHNNTGEMITADGYFVKYQDMRLSDLKTLQNIELNAGVTSYFFSDEYDCFMLWNDFLAPYTEKYIFEKDN